MIIPVIIGPTCIGKTTLALQIAKEINADIISIDSRQVFKELDIGTGKYKDNESVFKETGFWEISDVKIWGYDFLNLNQALDVIRYCEFIREIIYKYKKENKKLIATCGTGFYLDFLQGKINFSEIDLERKKSLQELDTQELISTLDKIDPQVEVDRNNKVRLITKILTLESAGVSKKFEVSNVSFRNLYLNCDREMLYKNADDFVDMILKNGVLEEYDLLINKYGEVRPLKGLIYKEIAEYRLGKISFSDLSQKMKFSLHAYIRRQQTYFKKMNMELISSDKKEIAEKLKDLM